MKAANFIKNIAAMTKIEQPEILSGWQRIFARNVGLLIGYAYQKTEIELTFGEAYRARSQQFLYYYGKKVERDPNDSLFIADDKRRSWTMRSNHLSRLAVDFNFFVRGQLTYDFDAVKPLGDFWEGLHPHNVWGGRWKTSDVPHFEMNR